MFIGKLCFSVFVRFDVALWNTVIVFMETCTCFFLMIFYFVKYFCRLELGRLKDHLSWKICLDMEIFGMVL